MALCVIAFMLTRCHEPTSCLYHFFFIFIFIFIIFFFVLHHIPFGLTSQFFCHDDELREVYRSFEMNSSFVLSQSNFKPAKLGSKLPLLNWDLVVCGQGNIEHSAVTARHYPILYLLDHSSSQKALNRLVLRSMNCEELAHNAVYGEAELASNAPAEMQETKWAVKRAESWPEPVVRLAIRKHSGFPPMGSFIFAKTTNTVFAAVFISKTCIKPLPSLM
ncbi:hypothetical protein V8C43DRAFT_182541 [Trichoderma afarasin]